VGKALAFDLPAFLERREPWLQFLESLANGLGPGSAGTSRAPGPDWQRLFEATRALTADREHFDEILGIGYSLLSDSLQVLERGDRARVAYVDIVGRLRSWAAKLDFRRIEMLKRGLDEARRLQVRNVNQQLGLDALAAGIASEARKASSSSGSVSPRSVSGGRAPA
jgi:hypothetical protein